ncbi:uncharacterized protein L969DRAFT_103092 [Mixia osmundae IAM 14324]|uniref:Trimethylguanosine synthase n=1 Tax=Mixia osmundae (strain CBS 9802 / IAM 14324 / JCM 22182 / KY 12970) TaxID=764103 RepID=G7E6F8_MIXOS|nr:uncharacterized protein L969DRAFT_103092 [Mixia osmundae IAM 14324]KEI40425.1 hypothetical protein L969DRAFT_103092 [Mixia osmundae IAM 14324]GAA98418.1 hypothetical protein E5Q_05104 [Mixia osmundae IAM 14324]
MLLNVLDGVAAVKAGIVRRSAATCIGLRSRSYAMPSSHSNVFRILSNGDIRSSFKPVLVSAIEPPKTPLVSQSLRDNGTLSPVWQPQSPVLDPVLGIDEPSSSAGGTAGQNEPCRASECKLPSYGAVSNTFIANENGKKKRKRSGVPRGSSHAVEGWQSRPGDPETLYTKETLPNSHEKYWYQRYRLFSRYDLGIRMDDVGWFSVTPEAIARQIAEQCRCDLIVDAFCGVGGNAIQFALTCKQVVAIDNSELRLRLARHNAAIYGVEDRITFVHGDFPTWAAEQARSRRAAGFDGPSIDVVFLSPPWGGIDYRAMQATQMELAAATTRGMADEKQSQPELVFSLSSLAPLAGPELMNVTRGLTDNIALYLPRNIDPLEVGRLTTRHGRVVLEEAWMGSKLKAITAYFGELAHPRAGHLPSDGHDHRPADGLASLACFARDLDRLSMAVSSDNAELVFVDAFTPQGLVNAVTDTFADCDRSPVNLALGTACRDAARQVKPNPSERLYAFVLSRTGMGLLQCELVIGSVNAHFLALGAPNAQWSKNPHYVRSRIACLVSNLRQRWDGRSVRSIMGPTELVTEFQTQWAIVTGAVVRVQPFRLTTQLICSPDSAAADVRSGLPVPVDDECRLASATDATELEKVAQLLHDFFALDEDSTTLDECKTIARRGIDQEEIYIYTRKHQVLGFVLLGRATRRTIAVQGVYVDAGSRKQGIAKLMVGTVVHALFFKTVPASKTQICLYFEHNDNPSAGRIYRSVGFSGSDENKWTESGFEGLPKARWDLRACANARHASSPSASVVVSRDQELHDPRVQPQFGQPLRESDPTKEHDNSISFAFPPAGRQPTVDRPMLDGMGADSTSETSLTKDISMDGDETRLESYYLSWFTSLPGPDESASSVNAAVDLPWIEALPEQDGTVSDTLLDWIQHRRTRNGPLFFDRLLSLANVPTSLYPPESERTLARLLDEIDRSVSFDMLKKDCLVYTLLKDYGDSRASAFADLLELPPLFRRAADGYWALDRARYSEAFSLLTSPAITLDFVSEIVSFLASESPSLLVDFVQSARLSLTARADVRLMIAALVELGRLDSAFTWLRRYSTDEPSARPELLSHVIKTAFDQRANSRASLKIFLTIPLLPSEDRSVYASCLDLLRTSQTPTAKRQLVRGFMVARLTSEGRYTQLIKFLAEESMPGSPVQLTAAETTWIRHTTSSTMSILPAVQQSFVELELEQLNSSSVASPQRLPEPASSLARQDYVTSAVPSLTSYKASEMEGLPRPSVAMAWEPQSASAAGSDVVDVPLSASPALRQPQRGIQPDGMASVKSFLGAIKDHHLSGLVSPSTSPNVSVIGKSLNESKLNTSDTTMPFSAPPRTLARSSTPVRKPGRAHLSLLAERNAATSPWREQDQSADASSDRSSIKPVPTPFKRKDRIPRSPYAMSSPTEAAALASTSDLACRPEKHVKRTPGVSGFNTVRSEPGPLLSLHKSPPDKPVSPPATVKRKLEAEPPAHADESVTKRALVASDRTEVPPGGFPVDLSPGRSAADDDTAIATTQNDGQKPKTRKKASNKPVAASTPRRSTRKGPSASIEPSVEGTDDEQSLATKVPRSTRKPTAKKTLPDSPVRRSTRKRSAATDA